MIGLFVPLLALAGSASPSSNEEQMAQCAWREVSSSAATLVDRAKFDKRYVYDADGSPTIGLIMRIRAACDQASAEFAQASDNPLSLFDNTRFLKILKRDRPKQINADLLERPVYRCEIRYLDAAGGDKPAGVIWGYGSIDQSRELQSSYETQGAIFSAAELGSLLSPQGDPTQVLARIQQIEPLKVTTLKAGLASGKPFTVDPAGGLRTCQHVQSDGSYINA